MVETREWSAWLNLQPPPPDDLHVIGQVRVGNPGVLAFLSERVPQGINPSILILDLHLVQRPGFWIQKMTWVEARFGKIYQPGGDRPALVHVFHDCEQIVAEDVLRVS
jgi:hypothetical protein